MVSYLNTYCNGVKSQRHIHKYERETENIDHIDPPLTLMCAAGQIHSAIATMFLGPFLFSRRNITSIEDNCNI